MRTSFDTALATVLAAEGGFSNDPRDPGGATFRGITLATLSGARGRPVTVAELKALDRAEIATIYRRSYWDTVAGDALPAGLDLAVFDLAVHSGPHRAAVLLQGLLGVATDGRIGPVTLAAARRGDAAAHVRALCAARRAFLQRLPTWPAFGRGWTHRVASVEARALALAASARPATKDTRMDSLKPILQSRTVWSNLIGLAALALSAFGFDTSGLDTARVADAALQAIAAGSFLASTGFRIVATKRLR